MCCRRSGTARVLRRFHGSRRVCALFDRLWSPPLQALRLLLGGSSARVQLDHSWSIMPFRFRPVISTLGVVASVAVVASFVTPIAPSAPARSAPAPVFRKAPVGAQPAVGAATLVSPVEADPVTPRVREVPVPDADRRGSPHLAAVSAPQPVTGFGVVGATWRGGVPGSLDLEVRTREAGSWSGWQALPVDDDHGPDPGSAEARAATRTGSDPVVVGDVGMVQLRASSASGQAPADLELSVVDPGRTRTDAAGTAMTSSPLAAATASSASATAVPALFSGAVSSAVQAAAGSIRRGCARRGRGSARAARGVPTSGCVRGVRAMARCVRGLCITR